MSFHHADHKSLGIYEFLRRPEIFLITLLYPEFAHACAFGGVLQYQGAVEVRLLGVVFYGEDDEFDFWGWMMETHSKTSMKSIILHYPVMKVIFQ